MSKDNAKPEAYRLGGIFEFLIRSPDSPLEPKSPELSRIVTGRADPYRSKNWFHADDKVPVSEFDMDDLLSVYAFFAEENGNSLVGGLNGRGLVAYDVITVRPRFIGKGATVKEGNPSNVLVTPQKTLVAFKEKIPALKVAHKKGLLHGLILLPRVSA